MKKLTIILVAFILSGCGGGGGGGGGGGSAPPPVAKVTVTGVVLDSAGAPVPSASVTISSDPVTTTTDQLGKFSIIVEPGTHQLTISKSGVKFCDRQVVVPLGQDTSLGNITPTGEYYADGNNPPVASSVSLRTDPSLPYAEQQLIANDPDGDKIVYELVSPTSGPGYDSAYINPTTGVAYVTISTGFTGSFSLIYRVTDGKRFSKEALIQITSGTSSSQNKGAGLNFVDPLTYAKFDYYNYELNLFGQPGTSPSAVTAIDLSPKFPIAGDQGNQGSCVGWATAYALKSYQEVLEVGWSLNTPAHLFSPAFIYNQINGGQNVGTRFADALDLAINKGVATLGTMPYRDSDYLSQPTPNALQEAWNYKASRWFTLRTIDGFKAALANRQPVLVGVKLYSNFYSLVGPDPVYASAVGGILGGHAVTLVGYDDNKYGGAFKVLNSWGIGWGDHGYFWIPYMFLQQIANEGYVLVDGKNGVVVTDNSMTRPPPPEQLPNLQVQSWNAQFDPVPRGNGSLQYSIINTGTASAPAGVGVCLLLSKTQEITTSDMYVVCEKIPFVMAPGGGAYRDSTNAIPFNFPNELTPGTYYAAVWVDDLNEVVELNEDDNIKVSAGTTVITNTKPDLSINYWYAQWNAASGQGTLEYEIYNIGNDNVPIGWDITLVLSKDLIIGNSDDISIFNETTPFILIPQNMVYRNSLNPGLINIFSDTLGNPVPTGTYFMALLVDRANVVDESNEGNNSSMSWGVTTVPALAGTTAARPIRVLTAESNDNTPKTAYNGKRLPTQTSTLRKVAITNEGGQMVIHSPPSEGGPALGVETVHQYSKELKSRNNVIFPAGNLVPMP